MKIDNISFKEKFYEFTNRTFDLVSTFDHPYASPPIRLVDGHNNLKKISDVGVKPLILIWDVNFPNINSYRHELVFDTGIFSNRDKNFFIFSPKTLYPLQKPKMVDFLDLRRRTLLIKARLRNLSNETKLDNNQQFIDNFDKLITIYKKTISHSDNGIDFYQELLKQLYVLIGFDDLSNFVGDSFYSYFNSQITQKWIPYCIQETKNSSIGFFNLLNAGLFKKPYFRNIDIKNEDNKLSDPAYVIKNIDMILRDIENQILIPSYEIFFWTLFLAGIKHYGNDFGFFKKINVLADRYGYKLFTSSLQLTEHNKDCQNIIQFEKDRSFNCFLKNGKYVIKKNNPLKISRISSFAALYCHLGEDLGKFIRDIFSDKINPPKIIKMGEII